MSNIKLKAGCLLSFDEKHSQFNNLPAMVLLKILLLSRLIAFDAKKNITKIEKKNANFRHRNVT